MCSSTTFFLFLKKIQHRFALFFFTSFSSSLSFSTRTTRCEKERKLPTQLVFIFFFLKKGGENVRRKEGEGKKEGKKELS